MTIVKRYLCLVTIWTTVVSLALTAGAEANHSMEWHTRINAIDDRTERVAGQRKVVLDEIDDLKSFANTTSKWLGAYNRINAQINALQQGQGDYARYSRSQRSAELQSLEQERNRIATLNGGTVIDGTTYTSLAQLQQALPEKAMDHTQTNREYRRLTSELLTLDGQRDKYVAKLKVEEISQIEHNKMWVEIYQQDLAICEEFIKDNNMWCTTVDVPLSIPSVVPREFVIFTITKDYLAQISTTPGAKFDPKELADRIKTARNRSDRAKQEAKDNVDQRIADLKRKIAMLEGCLNIDPTGCWVLFLGNNNPVLNIVNNGGDRYTGYITKVGALKYFNANQRLFEVRRVNDTTFDGTEYSYTNSGRATRMGLRLISSKDGRMMTYRSNQQVRMGRCN